MRQAPTDDFTDILRRDRQILVVGRNLAGFAVARFLDHTGLSPVLADGPAKRLESGVVPIWRSGLKLLERIGIRRSVEAIGTPLRALKCENSSQTWAETSASRPSLVAVPNEELSTLFDRQLAGRVPTINWSIESVNSIEQGVQVAFEQGVTETFDAVVTTDRTLVTLHHETEQSASVHWWAFDWPLSVSAPDIPLEAWAEDFAAFTFPTSNRARVVLVSESSAPPTMPLALDTLAEQFGGLISALGAAISELDESAIRYRQVPHSVPVDWAVDNIALVGPATHASLPSGCLGPALTIEDGWVLSDALTYGPKPVGDALASYVDRRRNRLATIKATIRSDNVGTRVGETLSGVTRQLCARRSLAFSHLFDSGVADIGESVR